MNISRNIGKSTQRLCNIKIMSFDNMAKLYSAFKLVHYEQQLKCNIEMGVVSTSNRTTFTFSE